MAEIWDLYDSQRQDMHQTMQRGDPVPEGAHHVVVDIWTLTPDGRFLLTQRAPGKRFAGMWECTGGSVVSGENSLQGALRELEEETGMHAEPEGLELMHSVRVFERFVDTYLHRAEVDLSQLHLQDCEVCDAKLVSYAELCELFQAGTVMPRERFPLYRKLLAQAAGIETE